MDDIWFQLEPHKKILILGFGKEGQSTYSFVRSMSKDRMLTIADSNDTVRDNALLKNDTHVEFKTGTEYLSDLAQFDCVIKSPGISLSNKTIQSLGEKLTSQADLFLKAFHNRIIGITGTKGKSTTASFIYAALTASGKKSVLVGNIGVPPFDALHDIDLKTAIVFELSSHMLQTVTASPHVAVFLNIFPEHLDYYDSMEAYAASKANIFRFQTDADILVTGESEAIEELVKKFGAPAYRVGWDTEPDSPSSFYLPEKTLLKGDHIVRNLALGAAAACYIGGDSEIVRDTLATFHGLPHRLENVGTYRGVTFINDSISTIPEAAIAALHAFPDTNVLIVGGMDRGIPYAKLTDELLDHDGLYILCIDEAGKRIYSEAKDTTNFFLLDDLEEAVKKSYELLPGGGTVMLSPAAASYTQFKNFEERGTAFAGYAQKYGN